MPGDDVTRRLDEHEDQLGNHEKRIQILEKSEAVNVAVVQGLRDDFNDFREEIKRYAFWLITVVLGAVIVAVMNQIIH